MLDRVRWALRLGPPGPVEAAAVAVAARELAEADVHLPTWRRARARGEAGARDRYVRLRVAALRRELRAGAQPLLLADAVDRARDRDARVVRAEAFRRTPEGEAAYRAALATALSGLARFSFLYFAAIALMLLVVWLLLR